MTAMQQRAFIISPIGKPNSPQRRLADWVRAQIIGPACQIATGGALGLEAIRSDEDQLTGPIMESVIASILNDRVVFAVLAYDRPNVYYELALAKAAGRKVIILRWSKEKTHFDVQGYRMIEFAYDPRKEEPSPADPSLVETVAGFVRNVMQTESHQSTAFGRYDPLARNHRQFRFYERFKDLAVKKRPGAEVELYTDFFTEAQDSLTLSGMTLQHFTSYNFEYDTSDGQTLCFPDLVAYLTLVKGVNVRAVLLHPENPAIPAMIADTSRKRHEAEVKQVRAQCAQSLDSWRTIAEDISRANAYADAPRKGTVEVVALENSTLNYRLTLSEKRMLLTPYFHQLRFNSEAPCVEVQAGTPFYEAVRQDLETVIASDRREPREPMVAGVGQP
ncbi:hypothetical protein [Salinarimonas chemoclinalis]|uniref:hypothetical protein n=1 Tax=Salinarimonas chemoclinalis TaxID=3241599 RepID=UPI0035573A47